MKKQVLHLSFIFLALIMEEFKHDINEKQNAKIEL